MRSRRRCLVMAGSCLLFFADLAATYSPACNHAVPWAQGALTAEFGMGSGGIPPLRPPGRRKTEEANSATRHSPSNTTLAELLARGSRACLAFFPSMKRSAGNQANRAIRTSKLNALLRLHTWPIDVVVFHGSRAKPGFEVSFPLRCVQRLSRPHLATRQCSWRHNRSTRGAFVPVLSY